MEIEDRNQTIPMKKDSSLKPYTLNGPLAIIVIALLAGCSGGPSTDDAQKILSQYVQSESGGQMKLSSFKKTDGQKGETMGVQFYRLSYEADITFTVDGYWLGPMNNQPPFKFSRTEVNRMGVSQVHSGDHFRVGGVMVGHRSEKGWTFDVGDCHVISGPRAGVNVKSITPLTGSTTSSAQTAQKDDNNPLAYKTFDTNATICLNHLSDIQHCATSIKFQNGLEKASQLPGTAGGTPPKTAFVERKIPN